MILCSRDLTDLHIVEKRHGYSSSWPNRRRQQCFQRQGKAYGSKDSQHWYEGVLIRYRPYKAYQTIVAARAVADAIRTSLGPKGMDKMIQTGKGETIITNDGNTMLRDMSVLHPAAKMLVDLANAQDIEAGDGTTSVVVIAGSLLGAAEKLLAKGERKS